MPRWTPRSRLRFRAVAASGRLAAIDELQHPERPRRRPDVGFLAVLFDCDGVLVDSEPITNGVLRDMLEQLGWVMTLSECMERFVGKTIRDEASLILTKTGAEISDAWLAEFRR